jgi:Arc/MetJ-type ribon-helix-helix transcriptional regulator
VRVSIELPAGVAEALQGHIRAGLFRSVEEAVLAGARLVAGLGPRALRLLEEGADADALVAPRDGDVEGRWM